MFAAPVLLIVVELLVVELTVVMFPVVAFTTPVFVVLLVTVARFAARAFNESVRIVPVFVIVLVCSESLVIAPLFTMLFDVRFVTLVFCNVVFPVTFSV